MSTGTVAIFLRDKVITVDNTDLSQWRPFVDRWRRWLSTRAGNPGAMINIAGKSLDIDYRDIVSIDITGGGR